MSITPVRFKRLPVGARFTHDGRRYRKSSGTKAFALKPGGTGETHAPIVFARNTAVAPAGVARP